MQNKIRLVTTFNLIFSPQAILNLYLVQLLTYSLDESNDDFTDYLVGASPGLVVFALWSRK